MVAKWASTLGRPAAEELARAHYDAAVAYEDREIGVLLDGARNRSRSHGRGLPVRSRRGALRARPHGSRRTLRVRPARAARRRGSTPSVGAASGERDGRDDRRGADDPRARRRARRRGDGGSLPAFPSSTGRRPRASCDPSFRSRTRSASRCARRRAISSAAANRAARRSAARASCSSSTTRSQIPPSARISSATSPADVEALAATLEAGAASASTGRRAAGTELSEEARKTLRERGYWEHIDGDGSGKRHRHERANSP